MAKKLLNRARMTVIGAAGTGDVTLGVATSGYQTLGNAGLANGDTFPYVINDGANWEIGLGTYNSSGPSFARTTVRASSGGGTSKITATSNAIVFSAIMAEDMSLASLTDASVASPTNGDVLTYNSGTGKWEAAAAGAASLVSYTNGSTTLQTLGSTPTALTAVDACDVTIPGSGSVRNMLVSGTVTWGGSGESSHPMRVCISLDGTQVWPRSGTEGIANTVEGDGQRSATIAGIVIQIPGDSTSHTLALSWTSAVSTGGINVYGRGIAALKL